MRHDNWFLLPKANPTAQLRCICLHYAGGNASTYLQWHRRLPKEVELIAVQLPGRANRFNEMPYTTMSHLVEDLYPALQRLNDKPYLLFGHSMGGQIAFELCKSAHQQNGTMPVHLIISGSRPVHIRSKNDNMHSLPDNEFINKIAELNGTPKILLDSSEYLNLLMPMLRADFQLATQHHVKINQNKLPCPLSLFVGDEEQQKCEWDFTSWQEHFEKKIAVHTFSGDHFFIDSNNNEVVRELNRIIKSTIVCDESKAEESSVIY